MAIELSLDEAKARFERPEPPVKPKPRDAGPDVALKAQAGRVAELEAQVRDMESVLAIMAEEQMQPRPPVVAEVFYDADGRVKALRMGNIGATANRDADGRLRTINLQEII